jgi:xanthine dehydrogenase accessory factor
MAELLWAEVRAALQRGEAVALTTITRVWGHSPREVGAQMLVFRDGRLAGTVGGGCGEAEVRMAALRTLDEGKPQTYMVNLTDDYRQDEGSICGGRLEVFIEPFIPQEVTHEPNA